MKNRGSYLKNSFVYTHIYKIVLWKRIHTAESLKLKVC